MFIIFLFKTRYLSFIQELISFIIITRILKQYWVSHIIYQSKICECVWLIELDSGLNGILKNIMEFFFLTQLNNYCSTDSYMYKPRLKLCTNKMKFFFFVTGKMLSSEHYGKNLCKPWTSNKLAKNSTYNYTAILILRI